jgi:hypothetical protein
MSFNRLAADTSIKLTSFLIRRLNEPGGKANRKGKIRQEEAKKAALHLPPLSL